MNKLTQLRIWDLPTRLFHWALVVGIAFMWFSADVSDSMMDRHTQVGEFMLSLVLFRLIWGVLGSDTARFSYFLKSPLAVVSYLKSLFSRKPGWHLGHNPGGGWMVIALLFMVLIQAGSGLFVSDDIMTEGPLYVLVSDEFSGWMSWVHHLAFNVLVGLIVLHVSVIIYYKVFKKTNLVRAMLMGSAQLPAQALPTVLHDERELRFRSPWLALVLWIACYAAIHFGIIWLTA